MEQSNGTGTPTKKKQVFFSIGSYSEREKRVIKKISTNGLFSDVRLRNEQPPREPPPRRVLRERPASLDATDSVKTSQTSPPNLRKFKPLESLLDEDDRLIILEKNGDVQKPHCPPSSSGKNVCAKAAQSINGPIDKPAYPPKLTNRSVSLEAEQLRHTGKVALTIAAYEGEPRTPTRLDFLQPSQRLSRSSSKASDASSSLTSTPLEEELGEPIGSRLQHELVATLKRSNLKKRHDEGGETPPPPTASPALQDNERLEEVEIHVEQSSSSVKNVATILEKSLTFRTNPEPAHIHFTLDDESEHPENELVQPEGAEAPKGLQRLKEKEEQVLRVEAHQVPSVQKASSTVELSKEQDKTSVKHQVAQDEEVKVSEKESKPPEINSIGKSLVNAFDEIITLTDDIEKKA